MVVVDWAKEAWIHIAWLFTRGGYCFNNVDAFDECRPFWATLMFTLIGIGVVVLLVVGKHFLTEHLKYRQVVKRREAELEVAPGTVMEQAKWSGENAFDTGLSEAEIAQIIKAEKDRIKAAASAPKDRDKGDPNLGIDVLHR
jgi:hypothetical protein